MYELTFRDRHAWQSAGGDRPIPPPTSDPDVAAAALLFWEEHCIECAVPDCYSSCALFVERADRRCARFPYGIFPNPAVAGPMGYGADVTFRRWAKLETELPRRPRLRPTSTLRRWSGGLAAADSAIHRVATRLDPLWPGRRLHGAFKFARRATVRRLADDGADPPADGLLLQFYCPDQGDQALHVEIVGSRPYFQTRVPFSSGWTEHFIDVAQFAQAFHDDAALLRVWIDEDKEARLVFRWLDLVRFTERPAQPVPAPKVKCLVWDLDHTLWDGTIGDDDADDVDLFAGRQALLHDLDQRGILLSIASKNDHHVAWSHIQRLGLDELFLYPAIHWAPKSGSLKQLAAELNIGIDSLAFVDDSSFERAEVTQALPQVRVYEPHQLSDLLTLPEFDVPATDESRTRRAKYQAEAQRRTIQADWQGDVTSFLRSCDIQLHIGPPDDSHWARCLELINRSNQFNLSGRRYERDELLSLAERDDSEALAFTVTDRHGDYGLVGFALFERAGADARLVEFVMSCRVAQKMVESTFVAWYARQRQQEGGTLQASVHVTQRNGPMRDALGEIGFQPESTEADVQHLRFDMSAEVVVPDVLTVGTL